MHRGWSIGMAWAASACWTFPWRVGTRAPPPRAVRVVVLLLLLLLVVSMAVPVVGTVTIVAATSMIVTSWEVATPSAPVLKGPPVATKTTVIPTIALVISGRIVPLPAVWTGSWSRAKVHERWKIKRKDRRIQENQREKKKKRMQIWFLNTWWRYRINIHTNGTVCFFFCNEQLLSLTVLNPL